MRGCLCLTLSGLLAVEFTHLSLLAVILKGLLATRFALLVRFEWKFGPKEAMLKGRVTSFLAFVAPPSTASAFAEKFVHRTPFAKTVLTRWICAHSSWTPERNFGNHFDLYNSYL